MNYYEYGDGDVLARKVSDDDTDFEIWVSGTWRPCNDIGRFHLTARDIPPGELAAWKKSKEYAGAFSDSGGDDVSSRLKAAMSKAG